MAFVLQCAGILVHTRSCRDLCSFQSSVPSRHCYLCGVSHHCTRCALLAHFERLQCVEKNQPGVVRCDDFIHMIALWLSSCSSRYSCLFICIVDLHLFCFLFLFNIIFFSQQMSRPRQVSRAASGTLVCR